MLQTFFKVKPIAWLDLPPTCFDRYGERPVSEANIGHGTLSVRAVIKEVKRDNGVAFVARFDRAKSYVYDLYTSHIASIIIPVAPAIAPADKADEADYTDITND